MKYKPGLKRQIRLCQLVIKDIVGKKNNMQSHRDDYGKQEQDRWLEKDNE